MQSARGSVLLFADADGATTFSDLEKLDESLKSVLTCKSMTITYFCFILIVLQPHSLK